MLMKCLPEKFDWRRVARSRAVFNGIVSVQAMSRLLPLLANEQAEIHIKLWVAFNAKSQLLIEGHIKARLHLICQRCLQSLPDDLSIAVILTGVLASQWQDLSPQDAPLLLNDETISLVELVEDELLLNIADVPKHEDCQMIMPFNSDRSGKNDFTKQENPFKILGQLKKSPKG